MLAGGMPLNHLPTHASPGNTRPRLVSSKMSLTLQNQGFGQTGLISSINWSDMEGNR